MVVGGYNGQVKMNPEHGYDFVWMNKQDFLKDFENNPKKWAPWVFGGVKILREKGIL